ncbi:MAG: PepSY domain-containing protein [Lautropia sp.]|nr:PepSY domain-containing protein [Lautropia sp.]
MKTFVCTLALLLLGSSTLAADHDEVRRGVLAGKFKPLAEVLAGVRSRHAGEILDVELEQDSEGRHVYEVRLLDTKGHRRVLNFDAMTGEQVGAAFQRDLTDMRPILKEVLGKYPGRLIDIDLEHVRVDKAYYIFLILRDDGLVERALADAYTGKLISGGNAMLAFDGVRPMDEVVNKLLRQHSGSVLEAEMKYDKDGRLLYEVDMQFPDGRLVDFSIDPVTSRVLNDDEVGEK